MEKLAYLNILDKENSFKRNRQLVKIIIILLGVNVDFSHPEFMIFDVGGKVPSLWSNYYENTDGIIFVIDSSNKE